ncbi:universal stress protein [Pseudonocardia acaciae]|uniref:universal stress protein n=1 Tax=Pseudonocardia acaciae TaxID=551276 RepID=UPI000685A409|nr:universal stress protein [Pseudonocardia acaciae]
MSAGKTIVVGVDDTEQARAALEYALDSAAHQGAKVRAVRVFGPTAHRPGPHGRRWVERVTCLIEEQVRGMVDDIVANRPVLGLVPVDVQALLGQPATVLVEQAARADLLVVGHRARGAFASTLLGSVGLHCMLHAPCTVTVVRTAPAPVREPERAPVVPAPIGPALA